MKTHYIFLPESEKEAKTITFTSLRHLCNELGLNYVNVHYMVNRKKEGKNSFKNEIGEVFKVQHFEGKARGKPYS